MSPAALVTGAGGLVGSAAVERLMDEGYRVVGLDNDMRAYFFGAEGSTAPTLRRLVDTYDGDFGNREIDIRDYEAVLSTIRIVRPELVIHAAAQPSHDWAASAPHTDFEVNALGTLNVLEAVRQASPEATVAVISTNKVYGDRPNRLPLVEHGSRLDLPPDHSLFGGIGARMSIDRSLHSLFGASKVAGDIMAQEYGRYFGMNVVVFRPGCITGPAHAGVELHGFLAYLMRCVLERRPYTVFGHGGKQVRCNIHADDLVDACLRWHEDPSEPGAVYNMGAGRDGACSVLEAIALIEEISGLELDYSIDPKARVGDHRWWITDITEFQADYPGWEPRGLDATLREMHAELAVAA